MSTSTKKCQSTFCLAPRGCAMRCRNLAHRTLQSRSLPAWTRPPGGGALGPICFIPESCLMLRFALVICLLPLAVWAQSPQAEVNTVALDGHNFTVPAGFTIERAAGPPLVKSPIVADFDEQ